MPLTDIQIRKLKPKDRPYKKGDEKGLYLLVNPVGPKTPKGSKLWRLKYRFAGKERAPLALGGYPDVSLADARDKCDDARKLLAKGIDPGDVKKAKKAAQSEEADNSFEIVGREWYIKEKPPWSESHRSRVLRLLEKDLFPYLGSRPIASISPVELLTALRRVEERGAIETAHRARVAPERPQPLVVWRCLLYQGVAWKGYADD